MSARRIDIQATLDALDPSDLDYSEWVQVGMALHAEGLPMEMWREWSRRDARRFRDGDFESKWKGFSSDGGITPGTLAHIAKTHGVEPVSAERGEAFDWDMTEAIIPADDVHIVKKGYIEHADESEFDTEEEGWSQLARYLEAVFDDADIIGYNTESSDDGKPSTRGTFVRTAGEVRRELIAHHDVSRALSATLDDAHGAWIRFNPLDGRGVKNANVTKFRFALCESDSIELGAQLAIIRELQLPCAAIVFSGGKSVHAIVHIDADDYAQYQERVKYLYGILRENGFATDGQNRNPSRLSRMPGVARGSRQQTLVSVNEGQPSWDAWIAYIEDVTDTLPDIDTWADVRDDLPPLAPELIEGVLRVGHKMLVSGPSKVGKSWMLIQLARALAEGGTWLGKKCRPGHVLYVNLEIDRASFLHRIESVNDVLGAMTDDGAKRLHVLNLRGHSSSIEKLGPRICSKVERMGVDVEAIFIDPLYKVMGSTDENSAGDVAQFMNSFDGIAERIGCSMIYCHHFSKGSQDGKRSLDMASGSGVFGRDPDASLALSPVKDEENGWKVLYTLREFEDPGATFLRFEWPVHVVDECVRAADENAAKKKPSKRDEMRERANAILRMALEKCADNGKPASIANVMRAISGEQVNGKAVTENMLRRYIDHDRSPWCCVEYDRAARLVVPLPDEDEILSGW